MSLVFKILRSDGGCCCCCEENWAKGSFRHSQLGLIHFCAAEGSSSKRSQPEVIVEREKSSARKGRTIGSVWRTAPKNASKMKFLIVALLKLCESETGRIE